MDVERRIYLCRMAEKIDNNKNYAEKIGTLNKSMMKINNPKQEGGANK